MSEVRASYRPGRRSKPHIEILRAHFKRLIRRDLGLARFSVSEDGDFEFRYERAEFRLRFHDDDPTFAWLQLGTIHVYQASRVGADYAAINAINRVNLTFKSVRMVRTDAPDADGDHQVFGGIDIIAPEASSIDADMLERYLGRLRLATQKYFEALEFFSQQNDADQAASVESRPVSGEVVH